MRDARVASLEELNFMRFCDAAMLLCCVDLISSFEVLVEPSVKVLGLDLILFPLIPLHETSSSRMLLHPRLQPGEL